MKFLQEVFTKIAAIFQTYPEVVNTIAEEADKNIIPKNTQFTELENNPNEEPKLEESNVEQS